MGVFTLFGTGSFLYIDVMKVMTLSNITVRFPHDWQLNVLAGGADVDPELVPILHFLPTAKVKLPIPKDVKILITVRPVEDKEVAVFCEYGDEGKTMRLQPRGLRGKPKFEIPVGDIISFGDPAAGIKVYIYYLEVRRERFYESREGHLDFGGLKGPAFFETDLFREIANSTNAMLPVKPPDKVLCYFRAEMDAEVVVKRASTIVVKVSREAIDEALSGISEGGESSVEKDKPLLIRSVARSRFIIDDKQDGRIEIEVPMPGKPRELYFDCRATEEGPGEIWILVSQGAEFILKLVLKPTAVTVKTMSGLVNASGEADRPAQATQPLHQLRIEETANAEGIYYRFFIYSEGLQLNGSFRSNTIRGDRSGYISRIYDQIEKRWLSSNKDVANFAEELRAYGAELFEELIPEGLQKILWERRAQFDSIQVVSNEPFIPWELVHLREPGKKGMPAETLHLAQMGVVRWPEGAGKNGWPPQKLRMRKSQIKYVIPEYPLSNYQLPEALEERSFLQKTFDAVAVTPESGEVRKIISQPGQFDVLHFACHGGAELGDISASSLLMQGRMDNGQYVADKLSQTTVSQFCNLGGEDGSPMIVLNACQTGRAGYTLTRIGGFANALLMGGAGAFIGASWSIGDHPAFVFTETLYRQLQSGVLLSAAAKEAREAARSAGDATWLAYVVYGHPHLKAAVESNF